MDGVRVRGERLVDRAVAVAERAGAVYIDGRTCGVSDGGHAHAIADEAGICGLERLDHEGVHVIMRAFALRTVHSTRCPRSRSRSIRSSNGAWLAIRLRGKASSASTGARSSTSPTSS